MSNRDEPLEIVELAKCLGVDGAAPTSGILAFCRRQIDQWIEEAGGVSGIDALESLVTGRLQMVFEEVRTDEDFDRLTDVYARERGDSVFAAMRSTFADAETFGVLLQRRNVEPDARDRFVAVIDCRDGKLARRWFTRWHEIAHRLTTHGDLYEPVYRSAHDPIERLMDEIAGEIGFYEPLFAPAFRQALPSDELLTFGTVESIISQAFPAASFQATLFTCIRRMLTPVIYLEAAIGHNAEVRRRLADKTRRLFDDDPPPGELRAVNVVPNEAAREANFRIPKNMRVPSRSVIHQVFGEGLLLNDSAQEDLSAWESQGRRLASQAVVVEARKVADRVLAIVQPLS